MKPDFSEFSYGYAFTEEVVKKNAGALLGAPTFPSLKAEGKPGGGYDVKIPLMGKPVFLQFKLCHHLDHWKAAEHKDGLLPIPYLRMHLRPTKHSEQHNLLLALEATGEAVLYVAPQFHLPPELNAHYLANAIIGNSAAFSPLAIGTLPSDDEHYIAFEKGASFGYLRSDSAKIVPKISLADGISTGVSQVGGRQTEITAAYVRGLTAKMIDVASGWGRPTPPQSIDVSKPRTDIGSLRHITQERGPEEALNYISRTVFDAQFVIVS